MKLPILQPENGNAPIVTKTVDGKETVIPPASFEEKAPRRAELLRADLEVILLQRKLRKNILKQQYENFAASSTKVIEQTYERIQKLISQLEMHDEVISQEYINQKFLRNLSQEWTMHTIVWRNKLDIETLSLDDLFNNLKAYESEVKGKSSLITNSYNVAFLSSSSTNSATGVVNTAHECVKDLKEQNEQLVKDLRTARISDVSCKTGLEYVEARLVVFKQNEFVYVKDIKLLKRDFYLRDLDITELKRKLELATKEKDEV
ncbi:hypothetical protein Tco_1515320 [Tanacetum coccineum]